MWRQMKFLGMRIAKHPFDLWIMQEIVWDVRPTLIIESGTWSGGSALYLYTIARATGLDVRVVSIDVEQKARVQGKTPFTFFGGRSTDSGILSSVRDLVRPDDVVLVDLDSDHSRANVLAEMDAYGPLVSVGSYMIVEDGCVSGLAMGGWNGPGPYEAISEWLPKHPEFSRDLDRELKFGGITQNPMGYLKRI